MRKEIDLTAVVAAALGITPEDLDRQRRKAGVAVEQVGRDGRVLSTFSDVVLGSRVKASAWLSGDDDDVIEHEDEAVTRARNADRRPYWDCRTYGHAYVNGNCRWCGEAPPEPAFKSVLP